ncbi:hypothetical protein Godav_027442 [Gossypium davidsonii]|uniref:Retrotransposon gag domain-containing protein n=1 Tax=Gossypium davidsonii TaxID=34287 RepID=A0A7J8RVZ1_GOSDV|nr:hypothetical protein [Gossypium davidsonii]
MLSAVEERVGKLKESIEDAKELDNALGENIKDLREQSRNFVTFHGEGFEGGNNGRLALSTRIEELEADLTLCRAIVGKGVSSATLSNEDVLKLKEFVGIRTTDKRKCEIEMWQELQYELKGQFYLEFIEEEAWAKLQGITQRGTVGEYVQEFKELILQVLDVIEKAALLAFQNGLKP